MPNITIPAGDAELVPHANGCTPLSAGTIVYQLMPPNAPQPMSPDGTGFYTFSSGNSYEICWDLQVPGATATFWFDLQDRGGKTVAQLPGNIYSGPAIVSDNLTIMAK